MSRLMRFIAIQYYLFFAGEYVRDQYPFVNNTTKDLLLNPKKLDDAKKGETIDLPKEFLDEVAENSKQLDKHMIWIAGGAISVFILFFNQKSLVGLDEFAIKLLVLSLILFSSCLWFVVTSFVLLQSIHSSSRRVLKYTFYHTKFTNELASLNPSELEQMANDKKKSRKKRLELERYWDLIRINTLQSVGVLPKILSVTNFLSYISLSLGVFILIFFVVLRSIQI